MTSIRYVNHLLYQCEVAKLGTTATGNFLSGERERERGRESERERDITRADNRNHGQPRVAQLVTYLIILFFDNLITLEAVCTS